MKKRAFSVILVIAMLLALLSGCGGDTAAETSSPDAEVSVAPSEAAASSETSATESTSAATVDNTEANSQLDFTAHKELLKSLTTSLPISNEGETLTYWLGFELALLTGVEGSNLQNQQIWKNMQGLTGVQVDLIVNDSTNSSEKFNLMMASGDYPDMFMSSLYSTGIEAGYEDYVMADLTELIPQYAPNYWTLVNSDTNIYDSIVSESGKMLCFYTLKDEVANPTNSGAFIRKDWLEELNMEVPSTYDELHDVLTAFKTEMGASEPIALYNTIAINGGLLIGGYGVNATLSSNQMGGSGTSQSAFYQIDGNVIFGATQDGTREYLRMLKQWNEEDLINLENMMNRATNPFSELNSGQCSSGATGYMYNNQPFGTVYSKLSSDPDCNWWPVADVTLNEGDTIHFFEDTSLVYGSSMCITTACQNPELAVKWCDYWYSYDGYLLSNYGYEGQDWEYNANGDPEFIASKIKGYNSTNEALAALTTRDIPGIFADNRLSFDFTERELACFDAWSSNRDNNNAIGSKFAYTTEESEEASSIYSDILTYVSSSVLQFITGDISLDNDWDSYVSTINDMSLARLTEIVQGAYDRAYK